MLHGFFDDSGKEGDPSNRIICAAGYIAPPSVLNSFQEIWKLFLVKHNLEWLHMKDFMNDKSSEYAYLGWDWPKKKSVLEDFSGAIKMNHLIGFGVSIDAEAWRKMPSHITKQFGTAQELCFMRILRMVVERLKRSCPDERVSIIFDCDQTFAPARFQRYLRLREYDEAASQFLSSFTVADPRVYLALQAADLLAWETRKDLLRQIDGHESRPEFKHMMLVLPGFFPDYTAELWTEEALQREFNSTSEPV